MGTLLTIGSMARLNDVDSSESETRAGLSDTIGPYAIEERIGSGGMGEVYRAYDSRLDRHVAVKHIHPESADDPKVRRRLRREAHAVAKLNHPAIVQIYDILETGESDLIVMELVEGRTLHELIKSRQLNLSQALFLAGEVASGLAEAHSKGVVHRDLKTENVMVTRAGHAKILDFGLAKLLLEGSGETILSIHGTIVGTGRAMSPEQAKGESIDHRSDLFSLGSLLYELVTGRPPFAGTSVIATLTQICSERPIPVLEIDPRLPAQLAELIEQLLAKNAGDRPSTTADVAARIMEVAAKLDPEQAEAPLGSSRTQHERSSSGSESASGVASGTSSDGSRTLTRVALSRVTHPESSHSVFVKTLVSLSLAEAARMSERLGTQRAQEVFRRHDRLVRDLLIQWTGVEVAKAGSFLLVLERPVDAVEFALTYHRRLAFLADELGVEQGLRGRVGVHLGEIFYREDDPTWGNPPFEVDAEARRIAIATDALAHAGQTLLTQGAADIARRSLSSTSGAGQQASVETTWTAHGKYRFTQIGATVRLFEARPAQGEVLPAPIESGEARRLADPTREISEVSLLRSRPAPWRGRLPLAVLAVLVLAVVGTAAVRFGAGPGVVDPGERPTLATQALKNLSPGPEADWIGTAITEMVSDHLRAGRGLRWVSMDSEPDVVVSGSYLELEDDGKWRVELEVRTGPGDEAVTFADEGTEDDLFTLASVMADRVRREAGLARLDSDERTRVRALWSSNPKAVRFFAEGLAKAHLSAAARARDLFRRAIAHDPGHAPAHVALCEALLALGEPLLAEESAQRAYDLREGLPPATALLVEAAYFRASAHRLVDRQLHVEARHAFEEARRLFEEAGDFERAMQADRELAAIAGH